MVESAAPAVYAKLAGVALIWGGTFIAGRIAAPEMGAPRAAFWRYVVASAALVVAALVLERGVPRLTRRQWAGVTLLGATGVAAYNLFFMLGLRLVPGGRASLIAALNPAATLAGAALFLREPLGPKEVLGIAVAIAGAAIVVARGDPLVLLHGGFGAGEAYIFAAVLSWAAFTLIAKQLMSGLSPLAVATYASVLGTAMLGAAVAVEGAEVIPSATSYAWLAIGFLGVFGTAVAFVWYNDGVRRLGPARASVFINLVPVAAVVLGWLLLDESIDGSMIAGGLLVLAGVFLINRAPRDGS